LPKLSDGKRQGKKLLKLCSVSNLEETHHPLSKKDLLPRHLILTPQATFAGVMMPWLRFVFYMNMMKSGGRVSDGLHRGRSLKSFRDHPAPGPHQRCTYLRLAQEELPEG
jgi:hypothetical protein